MDRLCLVLLPSFEKYWTEKESIEFLIIVPPDEIDFDKRRINKFSNFKFRFVSDDDLCPTLRNKFGWHKQQILKLYASKIVETEYYLVLDTDLILIHSATSKNFFHNNKPIFQQESASVHWDWWMSSKNVLKSGVSFNNDSMMMGVTPEVLNKTICSDLIDEIAKRNNVPDTAEFLLSISQTENWTEYTLYWLFVLEKGLERSMYFWTDKLLYKGIWIKEDFKSPIIKSLLELLHQKESLFVVIQSTLQIHPRSIAALLDSDSFISKMEFHFFVFTTFLIKSLYKVKRKLNLLIGQ